MKLLAHLSLSIFLFTLPALMAADETKPTEKDAEAAIKESLQKLSDADRKLAEAQRYCAVQTTSRLGAMGVPLKLDVSGKPVFVCCEHCKKDALANPKETLSQVEKLKTITTALGKLSAEDRAVAEKQVYCAVRTKQRLGSMGTPLKVVLKGQPVFLCCGGCQKSALANPDATLASAAKLKSPPEESSK